jgi:hypothetical protein
LLVSHRSAKTPHAPQSASQTTTREINRRSTACNGIQPLTSLHTEHRPGALERSSQMKMYLSCISVTVLRKPAVYSSNPRSIALQCESRFFLLPLRTFRKFCLTLEVFLLKSVPRGTSYLKVQRLKLLCNPTSNLVLNEAYYRSRSTVVPCSRA